MVGLFIFMAITIALAIATAYVQEKGLFGIKFLIKSLASFSFMIMGFIALFIARRVEVWHIGIMIGLLFGLMGDVFLATNGIVEERLMLPLQLGGVLFFLLGHIAYIVTFQSMIANFNLWFLLIFIAFPIIIYTLIKRGIIPCRPKKAIVPMIAYAIIIGAMFAWAINLLVDSQFSTQGIIIFIGAFLFTLSDMLLTFYYFCDFDGKKRRKNIIAFIYMPAYYIAQTLFALAIIF